MNTKELREWVWNNINLNEDDIEVDELSNYIINNGNLYRRHTQPIIKNLKRKIEKGYVKTHFCPVL